MPIHKTTKPIVIDGVLDEPAWKHATSIDVNWIWGKVGVQSKEPRMKAWYTWDDEYLYIAYETFDRNLVALGTGERKGPKDNQIEGAKSTMTPRRSMSSRCLSLWRPADLLGNSPQRAEPVQRHPHSPSFDWIVRREV